MIQSNLTMQAVNYAILMCQGEIPLPFSATCPAVLYEFCMKQFAWTDFSCFPAVSSPVGLL